MFVFYLPLFLNLTYFYFPLKKKKKYRSGYDKASQGFNSSDLNVDLTGRSFMVTGANSGIGFATCKAIAQRGKKKKKKSLFKKI